MNEQGNCAQVVNTGEEISHPLRHLQVHWEHTRRVWNSREVYSERKVCVWFSFWLYRTSSLWFPADFHNKKSTAAHQLDVGSWKFGFFEGIHLSVCSMCLLCKEKASGLLRNIPVNLVLGYILLSLSDLHGSIMLASWGTGGGAATHLISLHLLLDFRDVPVRPDVHRLSLPLHRQHTGERTEVKPDE